MVTIPAGGWRPRRYQMPAWDAWIDGSLRQLLVWHRRAGKDDMALNMAAAAAHMRPASYIHMLPIYAQARKAIWTAVNPHTGKRRIDEAFPLELRSSTNDNEMFIRFKSGATWQVAGSDRFDTLVGTSYGGIVFSEWALANPTAWAYLAPILAENGGWATFITTPRGNNHVKKMLDTAKADPKWFTQVLGIKDTKAISEDAVEDQRGIYAALFGAEIADMLIEQEYHCSFAGAMVGSYYGAAMDRAERAGRICETTIDRSKPVHVAWDIGVSDSTVLWCFQVILGKPVLVDYHEAHGQGLEYYADWLKDRAYHGDDFVPHDVMVQEWGTGRTRWESMKAMGRKPKRVASVSRADGINACRQMIEVATFDAVKCAAGIEALKAYRREWDDDRKVFKDAPLHDWSSHGADAARYLALAWKDTTPKVKPEEPAKELVYTATANGVVGNIDVRRAVEAMVRRRRGEA